MLTLFSSSPTKSPITPSQQQRGRFSMSAACRKRPHTDTQKGSKSRGTRRLRIGAIAIPSTPSGAVRFSAFLFGLGVRRGCIHSVSRPPLIAVRSSALLFVGSFAVPVLHSSTPMLYYRSCIGLWCCRAPPLSGRSVKELASLVTLKR